MIQVDCSTEDMDEKVDAFLGEKNQKTADELAKKKAWAGDPAIDRLMVRLRCWVGLSRWENRKVAELIVLTAGKFVAEGRFLRGAGVGNAARLGKAAL